MNHVLIIEDDPFQSAILERILIKNADYTVNIASNGTESLYHIEEHLDVALVLLDLGLPDMDGIFLLEQIKKRRPTLPVIIVTSSEDLSHAVQAIQKGALDYLSKPVEKERIMIAVQNALKMQALSEEVSRLKRKEHQHTLFTDLIGHRQGLRSIIHVSQKAAQSDIPILINGETGVGKELFARAIHGESSRSDKPFIAVNCGAIPAQLVESTLFGHKKGSFTGAISNNKGKFREADGGTIFLDEIGELPLNIQVSLLRTLQQNEVEPVGATTPHPINVRVISATHRSLPDEVKKGNFRQDLFFRLHGLPIKIPPLRDRKKDILDLAHCFIEHFSRQDNIESKALSPDALHMLEHYHWPGNVRELKNLVHRLLILSDTAIISKIDIQSVMIPETHISNSMQADITLQEHPSHIRIIDDVGSILPLNLIEQQAFHIVMQHYNNNITKAHHALGIAKSTFYRKWDRIKRTKNGEW